MSAVTETITRNRSGATSVIALNLIPLIGVFLFGWSVFQIVILYWFESFLLAVSEVIQAPFEKTDAEKKTSLKKILAKRCSPFLKWFRIAGFCLSRLFQGLVRLFVRLFIFTICLAMYGMAIVQFLTDEKLSVPEWMTEHPMLAGNYGILNLLFTGEMKWAAVAIAVGFTWRYANRLILRKRAGLPVIGEDSKFLIRVVMLHLVVAIGGLAIGAMGSSIPLLFLLVAGKTLMELFLEPDFEAGEPIEGKQSD